MVVVVVRSRLTDNDVSFQMEDDRRGNKKAVRRFEEETREEAKWLV